MTRLLALPLAMAAVSLIAMPPGTQQSPAQMTTHDSTPVFKTAVNVVDVPVVVRDYKGRAVGTLTKDDFQLFDRGKLQKITKFTLEKSVGPDVIVPMAGETKESPAIEALPAEILPERFVAYLFDDVHVSINDLAMARDAADRHMKRSIGPKTRAAIFTTSGQTMLDFTDDREKWHEALYKLQIRPVARDTVPCPPLTYDWARAIDAGDGDAARVGLDTCGTMELWHAVQSRLAATEQESTLGFQTLQDLAKRMSVLPGERTIVLASPGFLPRSADQQSYLIDHAIHDKVVINALDVRGLATMPGSVAPGSPGWWAWQDFNHRMDMMAVLANGTGGYFYHNNNDLDTGFDRVAGNPEYRYILSFAPADLKPDGSVHALKVAIVPNPHHYDLDARHNYIAPKRLDDPVEQAKQEITAAIFSRDELRDLSIDVHTGFVRLAPQRIRLTVNTHVDLKGVKLHKDAGRNRGDLTVTAAVFDNNGNYIAGIERGVDLQLKEETLEHWISNGIQVPAILEVKPGNYLVRVVVRDTEGQLMAAHNGSVNIQ